MMTIGMMRIPIRLLVLILKFGRELSVQFGSLADGNHFLKFMLFWFSFPRHSLFFKIDFRFSFASLRIGHFFLFLSGSHSVWSLGYGK